MTATSTTTGIEAFLREFVKGQAYAQATEQGLSFTSEDIEQLFGRLRQRPAAVLPHFREVEKTPVDNWLIVGADRSSADELLEGIRRFIVPTYAVHFGNVPVFLEFSLTRPLGQAAQALFAGYYRLVSRKQDRETILRLLLQYYALADQASAPSAFQIDAYSYRSLYSEFQRALLAGEWDEAIKTLEFIGSVNLTTAENMHFLRIEWFARQERWQEIWNHPHYRQLAQIPVPQPIRGAMLTAFHAAKLYALEMDEEWDSVLAALRVERPNLGQLLSGRFTLKQPSILRVFGYLAVLDEDHSMFDRTWADVPQSDFQTRFILSALKDRLPTAPQQATNLSAKLQQALNHYDYESAWLLAFELIDPVEQTAALLQIAYLSHLTELAKEALAQFEKLYIESRRLIEQRYPSINEWIIQLRTQMGIGEQDPIHTWDEWFARALADPTDPRLLRAIQSVSELAGNLLGTPTEIESTTRSLADIPNELYRTTPIIQHAVRQLVETCLKDELFPRSGDAISELYEYLLEFTTFDEQNDQNSVLLLRLQQAVLLNHPALRPAAVARLAQWFAQPVPALRDKMLEGLELLAQYGAQPGEVYIWFRDWAENLLSGHKLDRVDLEVWGSFARWCGPETDLARRFEAELQGKSGEDPLANQRDGFQIAIFSLDEGAVNRARDILLARNPALVVHICREMDNNRTVEQLARNADLVVLVTSAITHAISYAIKPLASDRLVFANARGATSVLRAIESFLQH